MSSINITLDNYDNACYPGQTLTGTVECNFYKEKNLRAIRLKFRGRAKTEWTERQRRHGRRKRSRSISFHAEESYFDTEYNLVEGGENFSLPAGRHTYPFSYILPAQLPSSFEGCYGNIRYYIKATVDRPWKFDYEDKFSLNVVSPLDLNYIPGLREPIATSVDKTMCSCWCNDSGTLTFNMSLPASGFVSGQEVNIGAYVQNMTNVNVKNVKFKIVGYIEFITHHPSTKTRYDEILIVECREGGIGAHSEKSWTATLTIPSEHIANLIPCSIINVSYSLEATVVVPCPHTNLENDKMQVMIGTVPLSGISTTFPGDPPILPFPLPSSPTPEGTPFLPYPASGDAKYPPAASSCPPEGVSNGFEDVKSPSAPPGEAPYPSGTASYPAGGAAYPSGIVGAPHPSAGAPNPSAPSEALPSYEEVQNLKEKSEKSED